MCEARIQLLPVGRGDCLLLHFPDRSWAIIDCGQRRAGYEPYVRAATFLNNEKPTDSPVRFILATHPHADHDGGILQLMELLGRTRDVHAVYYSGVERCAAPASGSSISDDWDYSFVEEGRARVARGEMRECRALTRGETIKLEPPIDDIRITVLWPEAKTVRDVNASSGSMPISGETANNLSVVLRLEFWGHVALLLGDVQGSVCASVVMQDFKGVVPGIIKAPHHGARESILPWHLAGGIGHHEGYVLISSRTNEAKHPHPEFLRSIPVQCWKIRCTGLARTCARRQKPEPSPVSEPSSLVPEGLRRTLFSPLGNRRFPQIASMEECCLDNHITIPKTGPVAHSRESRTCDGFRDFS